MVLCSGGGDVGCCWGGGGRVRECIYGIVPLFLFCFIFYLTDLCVCVTVCGCVCLTTASCTFIG